MKKIHLVCNAHLDPVWLWRKSEGMTETMATFRIVADFCERNEKFRDRRKFCVKVNKKHPFRQVLDI